MDKSEELKNAHSMLNGWLEAERTVMTSQEYRMGSRTLRRADLSEIAKRINYWRNEVLRIEKGSNSRIRVQSGVPRNI